MEASIPPESGLILASELQRVALVIGVVAVGLCMWRVVSVRGASGGENAAVSLSGWLALIGLEAGVATVSGNFHAWSLAGCFGVTAVLLWLGARRREQSVSISHNAQDLDTRGHRPTRRGPSRSMLLGLLLVGVWLRSPPADPVFAGRDDGTYVLQGYQIARTGSYEQWRPRLTVDSDVSSDHLRSLYPRSEATHRLGRYDAGYRPGWYLADLDRGHVVPQFFHVLPSLLAVGLLVDPDRGAQAVVWLIAVACLVSFAALTRRIWPLGPWSAVATCVYAIAPLLVWTQRHPLTEPLTGVLVCTSVLLLLRARAGGDLVLAAALWGTTAWVRGNAWLAAPVLLAILWLRPRTREQHVAVAVYLALLGGSVFVHTETVFPYVYDEMLRHLGDLALGAREVQGAFGAGVLAWVVVDLVAARWFSSQLRERLVGAAYWILPLVVVAAGVVYLGTDSENGALHSRLRLLGPGLGPGLSWFAAIGACVWWLTGAKPDRPWIVGFLASVALLLVVLARHNSPHLYLFYYGRYLVPEIVPAAIVAAVSLPAGLDRLGWIHAKHWRSYLPVALAVWIVAEVGVRWLRAPAMAIDQHAGKREVVAWLADRIEPEAVVIAGGQGWRGPHVFNQVGGALEMMYGREVLPYMSREVAHQTLSAVLLGDARPVGSARGLTADNDGPGPRRAVAYLLVDEAGRAYPADDGSRVAVVDDVVWPPFRVERVDTVELHSDALVRRREVMPRDVVRHELRVALLRVTVDDDALARREWISARGKKGGRGGKRTKTGRCFDKHGKLSFALPKGEPGPVAVSIVAASGADWSGSWRVHVDGERLVSTGAGGAVMRFEWAERPTEVTLSAPKRKGLSGCRLGMIAGLGIDPLSPVSPGKGSQLTVGIDELRPTRWRSGRVLTADSVRLQSETDGDPMRLSADRRSIQFAPVLLPPASSYDVVVTLRSIENPDRQPVEVLVDGSVVQQFVPPDHTLGHWSAPPVRLDAGQVGYAPRVTVRFAAPGQGSAVIREVIVAAR